MKNTGLLLVGCLTAGLAFADAPKPTAQMLEQGKKTFATSCVACHGEKGDGNGPAGAALNPRPRNFATEPFKQGDKPAEVFKSISEGVKGTPMVAFSYLPEADRWALTYWVLELKKPGSVLKEEKPAAKKGKGAKK